LVFRKYCSDEEHPSTEFLVKTFTQRRSRPAASKPPPIGETLESHHVQRQGRLSRRRQNHMALTPVVCLVVEIGEIGITK
jgi:hypothetical protein